MPTVLSPLSLSNSPLTNVAMLSRKGYMYESIMFLHSQFSYYSMKTFSTFLVASLSSYLCRFTTILNHSSLQSIPFSQFRIINHAPVTNSVCMFDLTPPVQTEYPTIKESTSLLILYSRKRFILLWQITMIEMCLVIPQEALGTNLRSYGC